MTQGAQQRVSKCHVPSNHEGAGVAAGSRSCLAPDLKWTLKNFTTSTPGVTVLNYVHEFLDNPPLKKQNLIPPI